MAKRGRKSSRDLSDLACPHPQCAAHGKPGIGNLVANGTYMTRQGLRRRYQCRTCGQSFCSTSGAIFYDRRTPDQKIISAIKLLLKGMTIRQTAELIGAKPQTVRSWLTMAASQRAAFQRLLLTEPGVSAAEVAALWAAVDADSLRQRAVRWRRRRGW